MPFLLVQPWGKDRNREATVVEIHETVTDAYAALDKIAERLQRNGLPGDELEMHIVDDQRQPVARPGVQ